MEDNHAYLCFVIALAAASLVAACSERPTAPQRAADQRTNLSASRGAESNAGKRAPLLTDVPVAGALVGGGTFTGRLTATKITIDQVTRQLTMTGVLNGTAVKATGEVVDVANQTFTAPMSINRPGSTATLIQPAAQASCSILHLDLGPLDLNLLGLDINLNEVILNVVGITGAGNLLGNLLCALTGLLDIPGALAAITHILDMVNTILSGLTVPGIGGAMWMAPQPMLHVWSA